MCRGEKGLAFAACSPCSQQTKRQAVRPSLTSAGRRRDPETDIQLTIDARAAKLHRPPTRNGGRHCCQPPSAPSEGSAGVRQLWRPEGLLLLDPGSPAQASRPVVVVSRRTRSLPSAALLGPIVFRVACFPREAACRARASGSSGASSGWSDLKPKLLFIACRWRSDFPSLPHPSCRCRRSGEAGTSVPITHSL